uniref:Carboxypeptidase n=1 Tax=Amphora coffeiformis TaxID=265554 RepID=A0A7S3P8D1_9STRA
MLYVEHPIGTGFSYGHPYPQNEQEASGDLDAFLQNFFTVFEDLATADFYVVGESYAGMFVPAVSRYVHRANQKAIAQGDTKRIPIQLKGAALGNGWIDPKIQGPATIDYSWWHGLIDQPTRDALHDEWHNCMYHGSTGTGAEQPPFHPFTVQDDCGIMWGILQAAGNPNAYDITTWDPNVDQITFTSEAFFNDPFVKNALHVLNPDHYWHGCQAGSGRRRRLNEVAEHQHRKLYMDNDRPLSVVPYIADLLDDGIPVVVYNGDRDMTTNMVGTELALNGMEWTGKEEWLDAPRGLWKVNDYPAGWAKEYKNLTFAVVYNSGHMVPYNMPNSAYDLLIRLLTHKSFLDQENPQIRVKEDGHSKKHHHHDFLSTSSIDMYGVAEQRSIEAGTIPHSSSSHANMIMPMGFALLVGVALGALLFRKRHTHREGGYRMVPDVAAQD